MSKKKNKNKAFQQRRQKKAAKKAKNKKFEAKIRKIINDHNRVKYRRLPGLPGTYPYQLSPIGRNEAIQILRTGHYTLPRTTMNVASIVPKGGEIKMNEARTAKLAELEADTEKTAAESALQE